MRVLTVKCAGDFNAGPKAPSDIIDILKEKFNAESDLLVQGTGAISKVKYRLKIFKAIFKAKKNKEVLIMQFPMYETTNFLNKLFLFAMNFIDKSKTIVLIHDLDSIRSEDEILKKQELDRLSKVNYIIVHNNKMKEYLESTGIKAKLYTLDLFDYLCDKKENFERNNLQLDTNNVKLAYAGNLTQVKSPFIYQLEPEKMNYKINIYGVGIDKNINDKLIYKGKFPPNVLPDELDANLGLIWDGNFDESDENVKFKNYTKYNNPHKLSCYAAAGIPVIVWRKAAISEFVKKYDIGYTIGNLYDINELDFSDYETKARNMKEIQKQARNGEFTQRVIEKILKDMREI